MGWDGLRRWVLGTWGEGGGVERRRGRAMGRGVWMVIVGIREEERGGVGGWR